MQDIVPIDFRVRQIIAEQLGAEPSEMYGELRIMDDLGADSLDVVEMIMEAEDEFEIYIKDAEAESISTVTQAIAMVEGKLR